MSPDGIGSTVEVEGVLYERVKAFWNYEGPPGNRRRTHIVGWELRTPLKRGGQDERNER